MTFTSKNNVCLERQDFGILFTALKDRGYTLVGPSLRDGAIVYGELDNVSDLPIGWTDEQEAGTYRVKRRTDDALFGYNVGPHSWKKFLLPPKQRLWGGIKKTDGGFETIADTSPVPRFAFIGVRGCELAAMLIQDKVFIGGAYQDPAYSGRRAESFIVAVNCGQAGKTCFCTSMNTGPKAGPGFDLALTEIIAPARHYFVLEAGSEKGEEVLKALPTRPAEILDLDCAQTCTKNAEAQMGRTIDVSDIKALLYRNYNNARWADLEKRCLACGNCTMVCPTCFCTKVEDVTDLTGEHAERWRTWDSCFSLDFSYIHGGCMRKSIRSRYRQWLTHKMATWFDQFGTSGCVGCGRCITWCPVGIDLTVEVKAIRDSEKGQQDD